MDCALCLCLRSCACQLKSHGTICVKIKTTELPVQPQYAGVASSKGIDLAVLQALRDQWLNEFDWEKEQEYLNG